MRISTRVGSVVTIIREGDVARLPAIRTVVKAVHAQANAYLSLANGAVLLAIAIAFGFAADVAKDRTGHDCLQSHCSRAGGARQDARSGLRTIRHVREAAERVVVQFGKIEKKPIILSSARHPRIPQKRVGCAD